MGPASPVSEDDVVLGSTGRSLLNTEKIMFQTDVVGAVNSVSICQSLLAGIEDQIYIFTHFSRWSIPLVL
tara:strand:- start:2036 stop:2245 length:210 start_codon:yes stop_codon:yes gene_type:complete